MDEYRESVQTYKDMLEHIFMMTAEISVTEQTLHILSFSRDSSKEGQIFSVSDTDNYLEIFSVDEKRNYQQNNKFCCAFFIFADKCVNI